MQDPAASPIDAREPIGHNQGPPLNAPGKNSLLTIEPTAYYTPEQWSALSGYTIKSLATFRSRRQRFPFIRIGGRCFYRGADLIAVLESHTCEVSGFGGSVK